jgi:hypothetical protein
VWSPHRSSRPTPIVGPLFPGVSAFIGPRTRGEVSRCGRRQPGVCRLTGGPGGRAMEPRNLRADAKESACSDGVAVAEVVEVVGLGQEAGEPALVEG